MASGVQNVTVFTSQRSKPFASRCRNQIVKLIGLE
jgi:hypothetical protein